MRFPAPLVRATLLHRYKRFLADVRLGDGTTLYVIQREDCGRFHLAADLDPVYAAAFAVARAGGVETPRYSCKIGLEAIELAGPLPIDEAKI